MYCQHCGAKTPDYSRFCEQCGKPLPTAGAPPGGAPFTANPPRRKRHPLRPLTHPRYSRIALWIRARCGSRIRPGMDFIQIRPELEQLYQSERARGIPEDMLRGFWTYINDQRYDNLLR